MQRRIPLIIDGIPRWKCPKCGSYLPESEFTKTASRWNGICGYCKKCHRMRVHAWKDANRERIRLRSRIRSKAIYEANPKRFCDRRRVYAEKYPHKEKARHAVSDALRAGKISRPGECSNCGKACKPQGHHPDYSKPLDVIWLCSVCHSAADRKDGV